MRPTLEALFTEGASTFLDEHWPTRPFVVHGPPERLPWFERLRALDLERFMVEHKDRILSHAFDTERWVQGTADVAPADAYRAFTEGVALSFANVGDRIPELHRWYAALLAELGVDPSVPRGISMFAAARSSGTTKHVDPIPTLSVQIAGNKTWRIAPCRELPFPTTSYVVGGELPPPPEAKELVNSISTEMPDDSETHLMREGSVIYVPGGYWHETEADEGRSVSLTFFFNLPSRIEALLFEIRARLIADANWRAPAVGFVSGDAARADARRELDALLPRWLSELAGWAAKPER
jgi:50S ribosomal protein L16 3-hydroxylase